MEKTLPQGGLMPQAVDRETFERVWRRVMPDQERSPIAVGPAEEEPRRPTPSQPRPQTKKSVPMPRTPVQKAERVATPGADLAPTRTAPPPRAPAPMPRNDEERLQRLMDLAQEGAAAGQALAQRAGANARTLSALAADHRRALRQLSAACFLVTGQRYQPKAARLELEPVLALALRDQFLWEQRWARACIQTAEELEELSIQELCRELAQDAALHNRTIRRVLERM